MKQFAPNAQPQPSMKQRKSPDFSSPFFDKDTSFDKDNFSNKDNYSDAPPQMPRNRPDESASLYFTLDSAGTILAVAPGAVASLGYPIATLLGRSIHSLIHLAEQSSLQTQIEQFLQQTHSGFLGSYQFMGANGDGVLVSLTVRQLQSLKRNPILLLVGEPIGSPADGVVEVYKKREAVSADPQQAGYQQMQRLNLELERQVYAQTAELQIAFEFEATLKRITDKVRDSLDENQILQTVVQELVLAIGIKCCNASLYNLEQSTSTVCYEYTTSLSPYLGRVVQLGAFPEIYAPLLTGECFQFCSTVPNPTRGRVALLTCPILDDQGVLGDLWLINHSFYAFNQQDVRLVQQLANQCAIAIRQARLYQASQAQVQELEKVNRLKDAFLSTVSHELRTPITAIKLATQMLEVVLKQQGLLETPATRTAQYFRILNEECQREISLINDLLDLSRLEASIEPLRSVAIDLNTWLPPLVQPFFARTQRQQQTLQITPFAALPPLITEANSLERILTELLDNACKYTPHGEQISIAASLTTREEAAEAIVLSVSNSGVEIPPSELPRIFDKFYRIPNHDPWRHGGTGMGLALVKELVARLGASIEVESGLAGTTFTVCLPLVR